MDPIILIICTKYRYRPKYKIIRMTHIIHIHAEAEESLNLLQLKLRGFVRSDQSQSLNLLGNKEQHKVCTGRL